MVMVIIGVLAGIGFAGMGMLQTRALVTKADTNWRILSSAVQMWTIENPGQNVQGMNVSDFSPIYIDDDAEPWDKVVEDETDEDDPVSHNLWDSGAVPPSCATPGDASPDGLLYCIADKDNVSVWMKDGSKIGPASNNPTN